MATAASPSSNLSASVTRRCMDDAAAADDASAMATSLCTLRPADQCCRHATPRCLFGPLSHQGVDQQHHQQVGGAGGRLSGTQANPMHGRGLNAARPRTHARMYTFVRTYIPQLVANLRAHVPGSICPTLHLAGSFAPHARTQLRISLLYVRTRYMRVSISRGDK
jgi:hypothetical protein